MILPDPAFIVVYGGSQAIGDNGQQDNCALNCLFPVRFDVQVDQSGVDAAEQEQAKEDADEIATSARNCDAADDSGSDGLSSRPEPEFGSTWGD